MKCKNTNKSRRGNSEGSITKLSENKWLVQSSPSVVTGKRFTKRVTGSFSDAQKILRELQFKAQNEKTEEEKHEDYKQNVTLRDLADEYITIKSQNTKFKKATISRDKATLQIINDLLNMKVVDCKKDYLINYFHGKIHYSQSELSKMLRMTTTLFEIAVDKDIITKNPMLRWKDYEKPQSAKETTPIRSLTLSERKRLIEILTTKQINHGAEMLISLYTGLRGGEICALSCENIFTKPNVKEVTTEDGQTKQITEQIPFISVEKTISRLSDNTLLIEKPKTATGKRSFPIPQEVYELLLKCMDGRTEGLIFKDKNDGLLAEQVLNSQFHRTLDKYGIIDEQANKKGKLSFHSLRKSYATLSAYNGMSQTTLKEIMGHTSLEITSKYYLKPNDDLLIESVSNISCDIWNYRNEIKDGKIIDITA